nr:homogentisate 1,2-dioxygenase [Ignavibacterium sp.]
MPFYVKVGKVPPKRHVTFYKEDKKSLYREELFSTKGFSGIYSNKYHLYMPTEVEKIDEVQIDSSGNDWKDAPLEYYHFITDIVKSRGNIITARNEFLKNEHCVISTAYLTEDTKYFYRNSQMHELLFIHHGKGVLLTEYGK